MKSISYYFHETIALYGKFCLTMSKTRKILDQDHKSYSLREAVGQEDHI